MLQPDPKLEMKKLREAFSVATHHASVAMNKWTAGQVTLTLMEIEEAPIEEAVANLDLGDELLSMVVLGIQGVDGGQIILAFDERYGRQLAAGLLGREPRFETKLSTLERSALMETGNILASAYLNGLSQSLEQRLMPTAPMFVQDFGASAIEQMLMLQAPTQDRVLLLRTKFQFENQALQWNTFVLPGPQLMDMLRHSRSASTGMVFDLATSSRK